MYLLSLVCVACVLCLVERFVGPCVCVCLCVVVVCVVLSLLWCCIVWFALLLMFLLVSVLLS